MQGLNVTDSFFFSQLAFIKNNNLTVIKSRTQRNRQGVSFNTVKIMEAFPLGVNTHRELNLKWVWHRQSLRVRKKGEL